VTDRIPLDHLTSDELDQLYAERDTLASDLAELTQARQHGAYTYCPQLVGHVTVAEFARKISEKRTALAQREEAVQYANEQKRRAEQAEQEADATASAAGLAVSLVRERAERAETAIARVRELRDSWLRMTLEPGQVRRLLDGITAALDEPAPAAATQTTQPQEQQ
jgi:hypothetical protein